MLVLDETTFLGVKACNLWNSCN